MTDSAFWTLVILFVLGCEAIAYGIHYYIKQRKQKHKKH